MYVLSDDKFEIVQQFLQDYINEIQSNGEINQYPSNVYMSIIESRYKKIFDYNFLNDESLKFVDRVSTFFKNDKKILNKLWRLDDNETFPIWYFKESSSDAFNETHRMVFKHFRNESDRNSLFFGKNQKKNILFTLLTQSNKDAWRQFYSRQYENDVQFRNLDTLKLTEILSTDDNVDDEFLEMLLENSYKILYSYYFRDLNEAYLHTLKNDELSEFLVGSEWRNNQTIFHEIARNGDEKKIENFVDIVGKNVDVVRKKKLIFWQNRRNETALMLASKSQNDKGIVSFGGFLYKNLDSESMKSLLELKNTDKVSAIVLSMQNKIKNIFLYLKTLFEHYLSLDEIRKDISNTNNGTLKFLLIELNENHEFSSYFLEKVYKENSQDLIHLFASNSDEFKKIFKNFITSDESAPVPNILRVLKQALTDEEKDEILQDEKIKVESFLNTSIILDEFSDELQNDIVNDIQNFFTLKLNIFNDKQVNFFKMLSNDKKFYEILVDIMTSGDCMNEKSKKCLEVPENSTNCENKTFICSQMKSIYSSFQTYMTRKLNLEYINAIHIIALKESIQSDYVDQIYSSITESIDYPLNTLVKRDRNGIYTFLHKPFRDFFSAQYLIENLYRNQNIQDLIPKVDLLLTVLLSPKCNNCKNIINFIINYIENEESTNPFDSRFKSFILSVYSDLFLKIGIRMIETVSIFFKKDEEILRKLWRVDDDDTLFYHFLNYDRLDGFDFANSIASKLFNNADFQKLTNGLKGKILYYAWNDANLDDFDYKKIMQKLKIDQKKITLRDLKNIQNFVKFFNHVYNLLTIHDKKSLILMNPSRLFLSDAFDIKNLSDLDELKAFWNKVPQIIDKDELNVILDQNDTNTNDTILHKITRLGDEEFFQLILKNLTQILTPTQYYRMMISQNNRLDIPFINILWFDAHNFVEIFWSTTEQFLNNSKQLKDILSVKTNYNSVALQFYFNAQVKIFQFVRKLYERYFTTNELQDIILQEDDDRLSYYIQSDTFTSVADFFNKTFERDKKKFFSYLSRKGSDNMTIFKKHEDFIETAKNKTNQDSILQKNLAILVEFAKENYNSDELKLLAIK